ncbi:hypothetical protein EXIGLDRAFT_779210 [Exidia glandulosa HHB12029]|uniref:Uncharacterized protein n=1 Tax=Exidia glandulosa HHB12029 TaxID=1314781 RepID=A0A165C5W2_EXIGL|nr:hypothetical protein EXIGLDRAFT_779210 [Exidia glandulosa HHB12029]
MSLLHNISALAQEHTRILDALAPLEHVPRSLETAKSYINDLKASIAKAEEDLIAAKDAESKEGIETYDLQHSVFRKLGHRAVGKGAEWDAKASKEEREYQEAHERRVKAQNEVSTLKTTLREAKQNVELLSATVARRDDLLREQLRVYSRVFDGPTPEIPQDDQLEWAVRRAEEENNVHQAALDLENQTLSKLRDAKKTLDNCLINLDECLKAGGNVLGSSSARVMEESALMAALMYAQQFDGLFNQAKELNTAIKYIPNIKLPKAKTNAEDIAFENIFTRINRDEKIGGAIYSVKATLRELGKEIEEAEKRTEAASKKVKPFADALAQARAELLEFRKATFEAYAAQGAPPSYCATAAVHSSDREGPPGDSESPLSPPFVPSGL